MYCFTETYLVGIIGNKFDGFNGEHDGEHTNHDSYQEIYRQVGVCLVLQLMKPCIPRGQEMIPAPPHPKEGGYKSHLSVLE